ncbi:hypothetical protein POPTR_016G039401v4 [Populus trichocarpa]|uniref:Uncharacterized protein n=1 Tax=Populus trichocarpa TaxID=3694 RepID=A0ACC0RTJ7_POPTR|nr:hypothetical protein POPTR_016G039401v4 [Populus trichocarpa]
MMKRPACWEFVLILGFRCLQGRRQTTEPILVSVYCCSLVLSVSL